MSGALLRTKPDDPKNARKSKSVIPPKLPGILRKNHKAIFAELREIATETHTLHRLWYKNHLQFRHMVWWRKLHGVRQMGMYIATGPLRGTVPSAGNLSQSTRAHATESGLVNLDEDANIVGVQFLSNLAQAYTTLWDRSAENSARFVGAILLMQLAAVFNPTHTSNQKGSALEELRDKSSACFSYVANRPVEMLTQTYSSSSKYPSSADACGNMYDGLECVRAYGRSV